MDPNIQTFKDRSWGKSREMMILWTFCVCVCVRESLRGWIWEHIVTATFNIWGFPSSFSKPRSHFFAANGRLGNRKTAGSISKFLDYSSCKHETARRPWLCFISPFQFLNLNIRFLQVTTMKRNNDFNFSQRLDQDESSNPQVHIPCLVLSLDISSNRKPPGCALPFQVVTTKHWGIWNSSIGEFLPDYSSFLISQFSRSGSIPSYPKVLPCLLVVFSTAIERTCQ